MIAIIDQELDPQILEHFYIIVIVLCWWYMTRFN